MKSDAVRRTIRTCLQLVASGALTVLVAKAAGGLTPEQAGLVMAGWQLVVTLSQNLLEDNTAFPALLKAPASEGENPVPEAKELEDLPTPRAKKTTTRKKS